MNRFETKLLDFINSNGLFETTQGVLLAVSGGADSVAMADALCRLRQQGRLSCDFVIGHVNHGLRGAESDADEAFVRDWARFLGIAAVTKSTDVRAYAASHKLSTETAGRIMRLQALAEMMRDNHCGAVAVAHHKDDLAETVICRLMRGTGFRGLCGIWPISHVYGATFIRPMLNVSRREIIRYCTEHKLLWRDDVSNQSVNFTRNRIRHRLLPVIAKDSEAVAERLAVLSQQSRLLLMRLENQVHLVLAKGRLDKTNAQFIIEQKLLRNCPPWVFYEAVRQLLTDVGVGLRDYTQEHFDAVSTLIERTKARADFPDGAEIAVEKGSILVRRKSDSGLFRQDPVTLEIGQTEQFGRWRISCRLFNRRQVDIDQFLRTKNAFTEWFDADKVVGPVEIRSRKPGDRFWPIGGQGEKKVARFLLASGLDAQIRQNTFIIKDTEKILWLAPVRMCQQARISDNTSTILQLTLE